MMKIRGIAAAVASAAILATAVATPAQAGANGPEPAVASIMAITPMWLGPIGWWLRDWGGLMCRAAGTCNVVWV